MAEASGAVAWDEIEKEAGARDEWRRHMTRFEEAVPRAVAAAGPRSPVGGVREGRPVAAGRALIGRLSTENQKRVETLLFFERQWGNRDDYIFLIGPACWVMESELDRLIAAPARPLAAELIAALRAAGNGGAALVLEKWAQEGFTTMGAECVLLTALRCGHEQGVPSVLDFLARQFEAPYAVLLRDRKLADCLNVIRNQYRNKACHGAGQFDRRRYEEFVRLTVANRSFAEWDGAGPVPDPPGPGVGVLHHHLRHTRVV